MHRAGSRVNQCLLLQGSSLLQSKSATRDKLQQHNRLPSQLNLVSFIFIFSKSLMVKYLRRTFSKEKQLLTGMAKHSTNLFFQKVSESNVHRQTKVCRRKERYNNF